MASTTSHNVAIIPDPPIKLNVEASPVTPPANITLAVSTTTAAAGTYEVGTTGHSTVQALSGMSNANCRRIGP